MQADDPQIKSSCGTDLDIILLDDAIFAGTTLKRVSTDKRCARAKCAERFTRQILLNAIGCSPGEILKKHFRYRHCGCIAEERRGSLDSRCPIHGNQLDLKPVGKSGPSDDNAFVRFYISQLVLRKLVGEIKSIRQNAHRFRVGVQDPDEQIREGTWYKPDLHVVLTDPEAKIQIHECKGMWREAAKVRLKSCAELYPEYDWIAVIQTGTQAYKIQIF
jgi:hypothetical protein